MLMNMSAHGQLQRDTKHQWGCNKIKKQERNPTRKINHWWIKRLDLERMVKSQRIHQLLLEAERKDHRRSLSMTYQLSLKVEREYIIAPPFTDDEIPKFTEDSKKITITNFN